MEKKTDKIFNTYKQYRELIIEDAQKTDGFVYGIDQLAARLTVAYVMDEALSFLKSDKPPTAHKINKVSEVFGKQCL
tara:strand:+ start:34 stop:264 length:231 start_codon:yes stop_codon:yes gene_type:complete